MGSTQILFGIIMVLGATSLLVNARKQPLACVIEPLGIALAFGGASNIMIPLIGQWLCH